MSCETALSIVLFKVTTKLPMGFWTPPGAWVPFEPNTTFLKDEKMLLGSSAGALGLQGVLCKIQSTKSMNSEDKNNHVLTLCDRCHVKVFSQTRVTNRYNDKLMHPRGHTCKKVCSFRFPQRSSCDQCFPASCWEWRAKSTEKQTIPELRMRTHLVAHFVVRLVGLKSADVNMNPTSRLFLPDKCVPVRNRERSLRRCHHHSSHLWPLLILLIWSLRSYSSPLLSGVCFWKDHRLRDQKFPSLTYPPTQQRSLETAFCFFAPLIEKSEIQEAVHSGVLCAGIPGRVSKIQTRPKKPQKNHHLGSAMTLSLRPLNTSSRHANHSHEPISWNYYSQSHHLKNTMVSHRDVPSFLNPTQDDYICEHIPSKLSTL